MGNVGCDPREVKRASMTSTRFSPRFSVWVFIIAILITGLSMSWKRLEPEASKTAYVVAAKVILERANHYKQQWLVEKQPDELNLNGNVVHFNQSGWLLPLKDDEVDCEFWLQLLYQDSKIFGDKLLKSNLIHMDDDYVCSYNYVNSNAITISLLNNKFKVSVDFSSL